MRWELGVLVLLFLVPAVTAFGVSSDPTTLKLTPGQSAEIPINLQNMDGNEAVTVSITWLEGDEIASLEETTYTLQPKTEIYFKISVTAPQNAKPGDSYNLKLKLTPVSSGEGIVVTTSYIIEKPIQIVATSEIPPLPPELPTPITEGYQPAPPETEIPQNNVLLYSLIAVILVALIILIILLRKKKK